MEMSLILPRVEIALRLYLLVFVTKEEEEKKHSDIHR